MTDKDTARNADYKFFRSLLKSLPASDVTVVRSDKGFIKGGPAVRGEGRLRVEADNGRMFHLFHAGDTCQDLGKWVIRLIIDFNDWTGGPNIWCKNDLDAGLRAIALLKGGRS